MLKRNKNQNQQKAKKPTLSHKSVTNKRARMMCQKEENSANSEKTGQRQPRGGRLGMHSRGKQPAQSWTDIEGPPGPKGTRVRLEANEGRRARRRRRSGTESEPDTRRDVRQGPAGSTRLRAAPLASQPTFSGPRTGLRLRPGRQRRTRRGGRFLSGPAGETDLARVAGPGVARAARGSPLNPRGLGWRPCEGGTQRPAGRRPYPGPHHPAPGPLTSPSQPPQPPRSQEPVRHRRSAPGPEPPASMRSRPVPREPGRGKLPAFNRSQPAAPPLVLSPPPPATSRPLRGEDPPPWAPSPAPPPPGATAAAAPPAPTEISRFVLRSRLAVPEFPREREACVNTKREPSRWWEVGVCVNR